MSQYMSCISFTYIVLHPENEKYLNKYLKYFQMYLYLNTFVFKIICIFLKHSGVFVFKYISMYLIDPMSGYT